MCQASTVLSAGDTPVNRTGKCQWSGRFGGGEGRRKPTDTQMWDEGLEVLGVLGGV